LVELAEDALAADDASDGLAGFLERATEHQIANRGLKELVFGSEQGTAIAEHARARIVPLTERLVRRAHSSGALRADVVATDLLLLQFILGSAAELSTPRAPELWRRYLAVVLDGLRTPDPHPLPQSGVDVEESDAALRQARVRGT
jgi:hypothetical protein